MFKQFVYSYVKTEVVDSCINIADLDFASTSKLLSKKDIFVERKTRSHLEAMDDLSAVDRFYSSMLDFYIEATC